MAILKFQNEAQVSLFLVCKLISLNKFYIPCKAAWKRIENSDLVGLINLILDWKSFSGGETSFIIFSKELKVPFNVSKRFSNYTIDSCPWNIVYLEL